MEVAVPQVALDLAQETIHDSSFIRIAMAQPSDVLAHDGDAHGDMEPVQQVLGGWGHVSRHVPDRIAAIGQEGDRLVFLPSLVLQDLVQPPLWPAVVGLHEAEVTVCPIGGHGLGDHDLEMRLFLFLRAHIAAIDADRDRSLRQWHGGSVTRARFDEGELFVRQFVFHAPGGFVKMVAYTLGTHALTDGQNVLEKTGGGAEGDQRGPSGFQPQQLRRRVVWKQVGQGAEGLRTTILATASIVSRAW